MIARSVLQAVAAAMLIGSGVDAQQTTAGSTIVVSVHDSLSGGPLAGAMVQLVSASDPFSFGRTGETDLSGRVAFDGIPAGRYRVGFMHPLLDAIGVAAPAREIRVGGERVRRVGLTVPSAASLRTVVCGPQMAGDSSVVVLGTVRDPRNGMPIGGASVTAGWMELTFGIGNVTQRSSGATATTGSNGWFAFCGLPSGTVVVTAKRGSDSTQAIELQLDPTSLFRRDLYVATVGRVRLRGRVVTVDSAQPIPGVQVSLVGGPATATDTSGSWVLPDAPLGTRMLEFRALGHHLERRAVDVVGDGVPSIDVALHRIQAVLDPVSVTATRLEQLDLGGFVRRRRGGGMGRFMTADEIRRHNPMLTTDLFRSMPGFLGDGSIKMRSPFSDGFGTFTADCRPAVYVDGHFMAGFSETGEELNTFVLPEHIAAIEIYAAGGPKPPQFDPGMSGCGSIVIWTARWREKQNPR